MVMAVSCAKVKIFLLTSCILLSFLSIEFEKLGHPDLVICMYPFNCFYGVIIETQQKYCFHFFSTTLGSKDYSGCWWKLWSWKLCNVRASIQP